MPIINEDDTTDNDDRDDGDNDNDNDNNNNTSDVFTIPKQLQPHCVDSEDNYWRREETRKRNER